MFGPYSSHNYNNVPSQFASSSSSYFGGSDTASGGIYD